MLNADPYLTLLQIVVTQSGYYLALGSFLLLLSALLTSHPGGITLTDLFTFHSHVRHMQLVEVVAHVLAVPVVIAILYRVVDHASKVLDFVMTLFTIHLILSLLLCRVFPTGVLWWAVIFLEATLTTFGAEMLCARRDNRSLKGIVERMEGEEDRSKDSGSPVPATITSAKPTSASSSSGGGAAAKKS